MRNNYVYVRSILFIPMKHFLKLVLVRSLKFSTQFLMG